MESAAQDAQKLAEVLKERYGNTVPTSQAAALLLAQDAKIKSLERAVEREKRHAANLVEIGGREVRALQDLVRLLGTEAGKLCGPQGDAQSEQLRRWALFALEMIEDQRRMADLAKSFLELGAFDDSARCAIKADGLKFVIGRLPINPEPQDEGPEFTVSDPDLNLLLNLSADMAKGQANHDTGVAWQAALEAVEKRLRFPLDLACDSDDGEGTLSVGLQMTAGQRSEKPPVNARLLAALEGLIAIANDSQGVSGYHQNGEVAEWAEFSEWTEAIDAIMEARQEAGKA